MPRRNGNNCILIALVGIAVLVGILCFMNRSSSSSENYSSGDHEQIQENFEANDDHELIDDFQLIGVADEEPAFQIGFGMGPGLYGSGRHTSEMVGN